MAVTHGWFLKSGEEAGTASPSCTRTMQAPSHSLTPRIIPLLQLTSAKRQAAELLASASAQARAAGSGAAVASLERAARGLSLGEAAADALPAVLARSVPEAHGAGCFGLAFNRAGTALASCGADKTVKLWDAIAEGSAPTATLHVGPGEGK